MFWFSLFFDFFSWRVLSFTVFHVNNRLSWADRSSVLLRTHARIYLFPLRRNLYFGKSRKENNFKKRQKLQIQSPGLSLSLTPFRSYSNLFGFLLPRRLIICSLPAIKSGVILFWSWLHLLWETVFLSYLKLPFSFLSYLKISELV